MPLAARLKSIADLKEHYKMTHVGSRLEIPAASVLCTTSSEAIANEVASTPSAHLY